MRRGDDHRLAALRLQGLADSDRRWILSRLADTDRIKLEGYLQELKGFQLDPETLAELEARVDMTATSGLQNPAAKISAAYASEQVLAAEPLWVTRILQSEKAGHRIGTTVSVLTPRALEVMDLAFKAKVSSVDAKRPVVSEPPIRQASYPMRAGTVWARLREAWRL